MRMRWWRGQRGWGTRTDCAKELRVGRAPAERVDLRAMRPEFHNGLPRTPHVQDLDIRPVHVESGHVVRVRGVERDSKQWRCRRACRRRRRSRRRRDVLWGRGLVEDGGVLETSQIECAKGAVGTNRDENICGAGKPGDIIDFTIVGDELGDGGGGVYVPNRAGRVDGGCDDEAWGFFVPGEAR